MMTSSNGNIFRVTGHLCGEFTGLRWISRTKASDAELWCFLWFVPEWTVEQTIARLVIWDAISPIMTSPWFCKPFLYAIHCRYNRRLNSLFHETSSTKVEPNIMMERLLYFCPPVRGIHWQSVGSPSPPPPPPPPPPHQGTVMRSFFVAIIFVAILFVVSLSKLLNERSSCSWFETSQGYDVTRT